MKLAYVSIDPCSAIQNSTPIIFLHGLGDSIKTWKKTAPAIVENTRRKAYLLDVRNHGNSPRAEEMDYDCLMEDVLEFMKDQKIQKAIILGNSMGGRIAINLALKHPEKVDILIVEEMTPKNLWSKNGSLLLTILEIMTPFLDSIPPEMDENSGKKVILDLALQFVPDKFIKKERVYKNYDLDMLPIKKIENTFVLESDIRMISKVLRSDVLNQNLPESNLRFHGDTLFVYGSKGFFNLEKDDSIKKLFPRAEMKKIEGGSHIAHCDSPEEFIDIVSNFILKNDAIHSKY